MNNMGKGKNSEKIKEVIKKFWPFVEKWLYLFLLIIISLYSYFIWNKYLINSDWSEEKKQQYIKEQSVFSFENKNYQQAVDVMKQKKEGLENGQKFSGRDIFSSEGF
jgi:hypothetical protein